jgi:hypothetical protein
MGQKLYNLVAHEFLRSAVSVRPSACTHETARESNIGGIQLKCRKFSIAGSKVLTAVIMKIITFWDLTQNSPLNIQ